MENINYFDLIIFTLVILLGLKGLFRGFIKEFFALVGLVGGVFVASRLASNMAGVIDTIIPIENNNTALLVGFILSLVAFWIIAYLIGIIVSKAFSLSGLGIFDRFLGFVFGAGKVFLLFAIIIYAVSQVEVINKKLENSTKNSLAYPMLKASGEYIVKLDTVQLQSQISNNIDEAIETTKEVIEDVSTQSIKEEIEKISGE
ncbi:MAG: CvpA family protein [Arcobacteraceae bacterium]|nr:CvpA family protein [Arcobacteraceae bacterium]